MISAMMKAKQITEGLGQEYIIFTADQQLYQVAFHVIRENQALFSNVHLQLGGMHFLVSYCGCIRTLMAETGMVEIQSVPFGGVLKMISGMKLP